MPGASFNISFSQGEFKHQPYGSQPYPPTSFTALVTPRSAKYCFCSHRIRGYWEGWRGGSEPSFSPEEMQRGDSVSPHSGSRGIRARKRGPRDTASGKPTAGPGPFSAGGEPFPALCRLLLLAVTSPVFPTPSLCPPVPPPFVAA